MPNWPYFSLGIHKVSRYIAFFLISLRVFAVYIFCVFGAGFSPNPDAETQAFVQRTAKR